MYCQSPDDARGSSQRQILQETMVFDGDDESRLIEIAPLPCGPAAVQIVGVLRGMRVVDIEERPAANLGSRRQWPVRGDRESTKGCVQRERRRPRRRSREP